MSEGTPHIDVRSDDNGCYSGVGYFGRQQKLNLGDGCDSET